MQLGWSVTKSMRKEQNKNIYQEKKNGQMDKLESHEQSYS